MVSRDPGRAQASLRSLGVAAVRGDEDYVARVIDQPFDLEDFVRLQAHIRALGVTQEFKAACDYFHTPLGHTPAGFRLEYQVDAEGVLLVDLVRDIAYDADAIRRPTNVLFSADSANPYEVAEVAPFIANLTCNPGIIYDLFINNPQANVDHKFATRDEVMAEIGTLLGPGCDISVELNNPFEADINRILEEAARFRDMLSPYRVVIKVPHTGPVNAENVQQLLEGNKQLDRRSYEPTTRDAFRGHQLALRLHEEGYRVNFTLMFEPYQTQLALQARPYFINSFVRHRLLQTRQLTTLLAGVDAGEESSAVQLRDYMVKNDYLASGDSEFDTKAATEMAQGIVAYRGLDASPDGLDGVRHNLRVLRAANLPETRLIVCSMEGPNMYPDLDKLLAEPEFFDMAGRVVVTAEPNYLARFASTNQVVSYQRRFMNAAFGQS